jgi:hypothetical protein
MFGFSIQKLLFTGLAIAVVIYGFRWYTAMQQRNVENAKRRNSQKGSSAKSSQANPATVDDAELMIECKTCGTYVSASDTRSCGRDDCPYPG